MSPDNDGARALALARSALAVANDAKLAARAAAERSEQAARKALSAADASLAMEQALGRLAAEVGEMRRGLDKNTASLKDLRRADRESKSRIDEIEDSQVHELKEELAAVRKKLAVKTRRADKWFWWAMGIVAVIVAATILSVVGLKK